MHRIGGEWDSVSLTPMDMVLWTLWMMILIGGEPTRIPLSDFMTYEQCVDVRDLLIADTLKSYPDDTTTRYYCDAKLTAHTVWH